MPGEKEFIDFVNALDEKGAPQHYRVMRRTYEAKDKSVVTYVLLWKDPQFTDGTTRPYIAIDIHYKNGGKGGGYIGSVWAKNVPNVSLKPEQTEDSLAIPISNYLQSVGLANPPDKPLELQDFDNDFYKNPQGLDAYNGRKK